MDYDVTAVLGCVLAIALFVRMLLEDARTRAADSRAEHLEKRVALLERVCFGRVEYSGGKVTYAPLGGTVNDLVERLDTTP